MNKLELRQLIDRYQAASSVVNRKLSALFREKIGEDITADQFSVLHYLRDTKFSTTSELSEVFLVGKSAITAIITRLYDKKLIERIQDEKDRRLVYLRLTEEGEKVQESIANKLYEHIGSYLVNFEEREIYSFIESFEKLSRLMRDEEGSVESV